MKQSIILHAKNFPAKNLFYKKFFDLGQILRLYLKHFEIKFLKFFLESDKFLLNTISDSASPEACKEVGGGLS